LLGHAPPDTLCDGYHSAGPSWVRPRRPGGGPWAERERGREGGGRRKCRGDSAHEADFCF
jgi:hypothetical protein